VELRTEESDNHWVAKTINVSLTVASMSGVVVLNVLWRMAVDIIISKTAISPELHLDRLIDITAFIKYHSHF